MSIRLQAKLMGKLSSHIEESYLRQQDVITLENVHAEMVFRTTQGFMEHESQKHEYLPCFHLVGTIIEVKGDFPFGVSSLYFNSVDAQQMTKDIIYYPSPDELVHLIQTGKYYSKHFTIPPILKTNDYSFPCLVNLMIVPPPNQALYEQNLLMKFDDLEDEDKVNLPIFYIGVVGTGVSRRNDRLLDYYGIELEEGYEQFVLTAESSGYTEPQLLTYMEAPVIEQVAQAQVSDEHYITPEEEAEMLHTAAEKQRMAEEEAAAQVALDAKVDFHEATPEDALLARSDRAISRRMEAMFTGGRMSLEAKKKMATVEAQMQAQQQAQVQDQKNADQGKDKDKLTEPDTNQQWKEVKMDLNTEKNTYVSDKRDDEKKSEATKKDAEVFDTMKQQGADVADAREQAKVDEAHAKDLALDQAVQQQQMVAAKEEKPQDVQAGKAEGQKLTEPDTNQQWKEVEMDLNVEQNAYVSDKREEEKASQEDRKDAELFETMKQQGADVANAREQAKVDEAHAKDIALDHAVQQQQEAVKEAESHKGREVPESFKGITEQQATPTDDSEYLP